MNFATNVPVNVNTLVSKPMLERIINATCLYFGIDEIELNKTNCSHDILYQRNVCLYLIKENVVISNQRIANRLKLDSATTVSRGVEKIQAHRNIYAQTLHDTKEIMKIVNTLV